MDSESFMNVGPLRDRHPQFESMTTHPLFLLQCSCVVLVFFILYLLKSCQFCLYIPKSQICLRGIFSLHRVKTKDTDEKEDFNEKKGRKLQEVVEAFPLLGCNRCANF